MSALGDMPSSRPERLDLRAYARPVWRWKWLILAITILAAGGTYALTSRQHKIYTASTQVYVQNADPVASITAGPPGGPPSQQSLQDVATLFTGQSITNAVYHRLGLPVGSAGSVVVSSESASSFVNVTASSSSPTLAARLANTYVGVFLGSQAAAVAAAARADAAAATATLRTIPTSGATNTAQRTGLLTQIDQYDTIARNPNSGAQQVNPAQVPTAPSSPKPIRNAVFAGAFGLILAIALAFVFDLADRRLVRVSSVQSLYGRPVLAVLPHVSQISPRFNGAPVMPPEFVEVMRSLRVNLRLAGGNQPPKSILVTSALPGEGKSVVARNLAFTYADAGERVLLIDCDLRRPSIAHVFGIEPKAGLAQVLRREVSTAQAAVTVLTANRASSNGGVARSAVTARDTRETGSISVLARATGADGATTLLSSPAMTGLLASAVSMYDVVILDTSPVLAVSDAIPLLDHVSAVLFVARLGMTTRETAERLSELGERVPGMNLVGVVVNGVRHSHVDEGYSSYHRYGYGYARAPR